MRKQSGQIQIALALILGIVACGLIAGAASWAMGQAPARTTTDQIYMIQPQGANPEKDYANSQTNLNNSEAQLNLAQATAVLVDAQGDYIVNAARSTQIVADSDWGPINAYNAGQRQGSGAAFGLSFVGGAFALVILLLVLARFR